MTAPDAARHRPAVALEPLTARNAEEMSAYLDAQDGGTLKYFHPKRTDVAYIRRLLSGDTDGFVVAFGAWADAKPDDPSGQAPIVDGRRLVGYIWLFEMQTDSPLLGICVAPGWRRQGIGRSLLERAIESVFLWGKRELRLSVDMGNAGAIDLYKKLGFVITQVGDRERVGYHSMALDLSARHSQRVEAIRRRCARTRIALVPYTHCDWAWVHTRAWHERRYALIFAETLEIMRRDPDYRWYIDNWACQLAPLLDLRPDLLPDLRSRIAEGRIAVCGGYANVRPHMVGDETYVRSLLIGRRLFGEAFPEADLSVQADSVDVATGHPQLPQLLRQAGYTSLRFWRPFSSLSIKGIPVDFRWEGLDGSQVLASRGGYGGLFAPAEAHRPLLQPEALEADDMAEMLWDAELRERAWLAPTEMLWLSLGCDDTRPLRTIDDAPADAPALVARWCELGLGQIAFATPVDYFTELRARADRLPLIAGTLDPCDVAYNAAWNGERGLAVQRVGNDALLTQAEAAEALASLAPGAETPPDDLVPHEALWRDHLLTCAHATQWLFTEDFAELKEMADRVGLEARRLRTEALRGLARGVRLPHDTLGVVWNPLPWRRTVAVPVQVARYGDDWPLELVDGAGRPLLEQTLGAKTGQGGYPEETRLISLGMPPMGLAMVRERPRNAAEVIPGPDHFLGPPEGSELLDLVLHDVDCPGGPLHVGPITASHTPVWGDWAQLEDGPVRRRTRLTGEIDGLPLTMTLDQHAGSPMLDAEVRIDWPGRDGFLAARTPLPPGARLFGDIPFGVELKDIENEPYLKDAWPACNSMERCREGLFYARSFVACQADGGGYALIGRNTDRYYRRSPDGAWLEHLLLNRVVSLDEWEHHVEPSTIGGRGPHTLRFSLLPYAGTWQEACVPRLAAEARAGAVVGRPVRSAGAPLADAGPELSVEPGSVLATAVWRSANGFHVRLHEAHGAPAECVVRLPFAPVSVECLDLAGGPAAGIVPALRGSEVRFSLPPWKIVTVKAHLD